MPDLLPIANIAKAWTEFNQSGARFKTQTLWMFCVSNEFHVKARFARHKYSLHLTSGNERVRQSNLHGTLKISNKGKTSGLLQNRQLFCQVDILAGRPPLRNQLGPKAGALWLHNSTFFTSSCSLHSAYI